MQPNSQLAMDYEQKDICANKHGGNENSVAANPDQAAKSRMRRKILLVLYVGNLCLHDLEEVLMTSANHFSGRLTSLKADKLIAPNGRCSHGSGGAIYEITEAGKAVVIG